MGLSQRLLIRSTGRRGAHGCLRRVMMDAMLDAHDKLYGLAEFMPPRAVKPSLSSAAAAWKAYSR